MIQLTATDDMLAALGDAKDIIEVRDTEGKVVGYFAPVSPDYARRLAAFAAQSDPAEMKRRRESPGPHYTTAEVFEHLLSLTDDEETRDDLRRRIESLRERDRCPTP